MFKCFNGIALYVYKLLSKKTVKNEQTEFFALIRFVSKTTLTIGEKKLKSFLPDPYFTKNTNMNAVCVFVTFCK